MLFTELQNGKQSFENEWGNIRKHVENIGRLAIEESKNTLNDIKNEGATQARKIGKHFQTGIDATSDVMQDVGSKAELYSKS